MSCPPRWIWLANACAVFVALTAFHERPLCAAEYAVINENNWQDLIPAGKETDAIYGDIVLRNDELVAVIAQPTAWRNANMTVRRVGCSLIDFTVRDRANDQLSAFYPGAADFDRETVDWELQHDGEQAIVWFRPAVAADRPQLEIKYVLGDEPWLTVTTTYSNPHSAAVLVQPQDSLRADRSFQFQLHSQGLDFEDEWWHQAYRVELNGYRYEAQGETLERGRPVFAILPIDGEPTKQLEPGESLVIQRQLFVADNSLHLRAMKLSRTDSAQNDTAHSRPIILRVSDSFGPVANASVTLAALGEPLGQGRTTTLGEIRTSLPAGDFVVRLTANARPDVQTKIRIPESTEAATDTPLTVPLTLADPGFVRGNITDEQGRRIPCKVEFRGAEGTPDPYFGPDTYAETVHNLVYSASGQFRQALLPGKYNVIISRGPEYDAVFTSVQVEQSDEATLSAKLVRSVKTPGWVSSDFHSHSTPSGDNTSWQRGRVLNLVCEQIEFGPCTEHNRISTYVEHLRHYGLERVMQTCSGMELTGSPLPVNHQNAFPLQRKPRTQDGGGPTTDGNPVVQIERLALWDQRAEKLVQSNHPNLMQVLGDRDLDQKPDGGFERMLGWMDVIEVHPPADILSFPTQPTPSRERSKVIFHWLQLINQGYRIPGVVNTDAHYNFHGSGWLRNYLKSSTDEPHEILVAEMVQSAERGNVIMTNGPYLEVTATSIVNGRRRTATAGDDLIADGKIKLRIRVQCANWLDVNRVQLYFNGRPAPDYNFRRATDNDAFRTGTVRFEKTVELDLNRDTHVVVATAGEGMKLGPVVGPEHQDDVPIAVSNPIFVDVDADGFEPNGDTLGLTLPTD